MATTTRFFDAKGPVPCPSCGIGTDAATGADGTTPEDGDVSICVYCGAFRAFVFKREQVSLRMFDEATEADSELRMKLAGLRMAHSGFLARMVAEIKEKDPATLTDRDRVMLKTFHALKAPAPTGKPPELFTLTGMLFAWRDGEPVFLQMPQSPHLYLALFRTTAELYRMHGIIDAEPVESVKHIDDGPEFLSSIPLEIIVILNLRITSEGRLRFSEVQR